MAPVIEFVDDDAGYVAWVHSHATGYVLNTDRKNRHRHAALCLATLILIVGRLLDWRNRWSPS